MIRASADAGPDALVSVPPVVAFGVEFIVNGAITLVAEIHLHGRHVGRAVVLRLRPTVPREAPDLNPNDRLTIVAHPFSVAVADAVDRALVSAVALVVAPTVTVV